MSTMMATLLSRSPAVATKLRFLPSYLRPETTATGLLLSSNRRLCTYSCQRDTRQRDEQEVLGWDDRLIQAKREFQDMQREIRDLQRVVHEQLRLENKEKEEVVVEDVGKHQLSKPSVVRSVSFTPLSGYLMKIEPFSSLSMLLEKSKADKYESNEFEAGGYKWKMILYPNGDKKRDGDGHVSLSLAMVDAKKFPPTSEVNVMLKFFVLDQINHNYTTFHNRRVSTFNWLKKERGISRLIPLSIFNDPSNGYLVDDCCTFGAEITVIEPEVKGEKLTVMSELEDITFSWKIDNFTCLKDETPQLSEGFNAGGFKWQMLLYPRGDDSEVKGKYSSMYLSLVDYSSLHSGWKMYVEYTLIMTDQVNGKHWEQTDDAWFSASEPTWGQRPFISLKDLSDGNKGFIVKDSVTVEAKINFIALVDSSA